MGESREKLREKEEKYRTLFEASGDAIIILQVSEKDGPFFVDCNSSTLSMFNCSRKEIIGKGPVDFSPPLQPDGSLSSERIRELVDAITEGSPQSFEWTHCRLDGTSFVTEVTLNNFNTKNETLPSASRWKRN